ncbi:MAG: hypothetical protein J6X07_06870 [Prevotella sp.]|nr:hypothetical protein [Prevotella sp.]
MTRKIIHSFALLLLLSACNDIQVSERLCQIDSLIVREQYDSANIQLKEVAEASMTDEERAHYYLLSTQLGYLTNQPLSSDSLLDLAILYYNKVDNNQKLADAYYYKSCRYRICGDYSQAIILCKKAEQQALNTDDTRLQFKIAENLSYLNGLCENDQLQLQYAKKALDLAQKAQNKNWMAYSYNKIYFAFANLGQYDSALVYVERTIPLLDHVYDFDKTEFLTNIGQLYKDKDLDKAKEYFERALDYGEHPGTFDHLADVYYAEGNKEEAYRLWKKALTKDSRYNKDNLIYSILSYDLERGNLEEASKNLDDVIAIKDSMLYLLRNDTIKDLQLRFDHEVAMHEADKKLIDAQRILMVLAVIVGILAFYIYMRRKKEEALEREHQMQLYTYTTEIEELKTNKEKILAQIKDLESHKEKDSQRISKLEEEAKDAEIAIENLNKNIRKLLDDESPKLKKGRMLYDRILNGETTSKWTSKDQALFNNYYGAINYRTYNRLRKVKRVTKLNAHNMFYLILKEMFKDDKEVMRILGISPEGLRSLRSRTKPIE